MGEPSYSLYPGRARHHGQDLTPYSAVSSFNLPAHYDSSLITPISSTDSPSLSTKARPLIRDDKDIKLSPSALSPYHLFADEDDYGTRYNLPMKHKDPSSTLQIQTIDCPFPLSPYVCPEPYFGSYSVSATPASGRTMESSPSMLPSPRINSAGGQSSGSHRSLHQTPPQSATSSASYGGHSQAPILIAPNPMSLRPATKQEKGRYRQNSLQSVQSNQSTLPSQGPTPGPFPATPGPQSPPRGKKRKSPALSSPHEDLALRGDLNSEERFLLQLTNDGQYQWKEVAVKFNEETGKSMKVPALQMRKKRLLERLRVWTKAEENALNLAWEDWDKSKWDTIADKMEKHGGGKEKWSKEALQKKWNEMHPENSPYAPEYETVPHNESISKDTSSWSEGRGSVSHTFRDGDSGRLISILSTAATDEVKSRPASDASPQFQMHQQQQHHQQQQRQHQQPPHQMMFEQHHHQHRNNW